LKAFLSLEISKNGRILTLNAVDSLEGQITGEVKIKKQNKSQIIILGGGVAGLAAGYYAKRAGIPFAFFEKSGRIGGNCITLRHGDFWFDSGAHRIHNRNQQITQELKDLLGDDLLRVEAPSQIFHHGRLIDFPLSPLNLCLNLGFSQSLRAAWDLMVGRLTIKDRLTNFESFAVAT
jgi:protoporphyrinogen oxidase